MGHEDAAGTRGGLVVEAKRLRAPLGEKETNFDYYLGARDLKAHTDRQNLIYLIDEAVKASAVKSLGALPSHVGILTWQQLGGIQIGLCETLEAPAPIRTFVAGAIQYQFMQHGIRATTLSAPYLENEESMSDVDSSGGDKIDWGEMGRRPW